MALIEINRNPNHAELRIFAVAQLFFFACLSLLARRTFGSWTVAAILLPISMATAAVGLAMPKKVRHFYVAWTAVFSPLGWLMSHVVLAVVYYAAITPIGLAMRLFRRDPMNRKFDAAAASYWIPRSVDDSADRYFRQF